MFERRLKFILVALMLATLALAGRAVHVQVVQSAHWQERAAASMRRSQLLETTRGQIMDHRGRPIAIDLPCIDAAVDYRAILFEPDTAWIRSQALRRLGSRPGNDYRNAEPQVRRQMLGEEIEQVGRDIDQMWRTLAEVSRQTPEQIDEIRRGIIHRVEMRRRHVWYRRYELAMAQHESGEPPPWYRQWLIDPTRDAPELDSFAITVAEQVEPHVVLRNIDTDTHNLLGKQIERFPGLSLRPSTTRYYPYGDAAGHLVGRLSLVTREDLENDPSVGRDELRQYYPNDLIGRTGLEALLEPQLRGSRGRVQRVAGEQRIVSREEPQPGREVRVTLDIELQHDIHQLFRNARMHGAAVVIDVPSGAVRALVSSPTFDPNQLGETYGQLARDEINRPLLNRATQYPMVPGSTAKTIVGLAAVTQGLVRHDEGIECTGFLVLGGRQISTSSFRCWTMSQFGISHHRTGSPHPTGFLTLMDAVERSCNIWFETVADQLRIEGLSWWFDRFGLGRPTGIGITESSGRLPSDYLGPNRRQTAWLASIGQGSIEATPLQMANVAATIARDGVWMRPRLFLEAADEGSGFKVQGSELEHLDLPDRVDLKLSPEALAAVKAGMERVVNNRAGTGFELRRPDVTIAGKTGSAQAPRFSVPLRDEHGQVVRDDDGRVMRRHLRPSTGAYSNAEAPWYRYTGADEDRLTHGWFLAYAPAERPQVALAVMVEYGGSGGRDITASITRGVIDACIEHGYLPLRRNEP